MNLEKLPKIKTKKAKRIGRGAGSGKGKTAGRGTKGQKARGKVSITHPHFEGGQRPLFKRLPYRRGKGNSKISKKPLAVNLDAINLLPKGITVNIDSLIKYQIVDANDAKKFGVKILGDGNISSSYIFEVKTSKSAAKKIEKSGGKVVNQFSSTKELVDQSGENKKETKSK